MEHLPKKVINYYASFYEVSKMLDQKQFYKFNNAIFSVMFYEEHIDNITFNDKLLTIAWSSVKHSLQASLDGFCSKHQIDYEATLSKGLDKGVVKGLTNNVNDKEKEKDNDKEKGKGKEKNNLLDDFDENIKPSVELIIAHREDMNKPISKRGVDMLLKKLSHYAKHNDIQFNDALDFWLGENWQGIDVDYKYPFRQTQKKNTELSYKEIGEMLSAERESVEVGNMPQLGGLVNKMRIM